MYKSGIISIILLAGIVQTNQMQSAERQKSSSCFSCFSNCFKRPSSYVQLEAVNQARLNLRAFVEALNRYHRHESASIEIGGRVLTHLNQTTIDGIRTAPGFDQLRPADFEELGTALQGALTAAVENGAVCRENHATIAQRLLTGSLRNQLESLHPTISSYLKVCPDETSCRVSQIRLTDEAVYAQLMELESGKLLVARVCSDTTDDIIDDEGATSVHLERSGEERKSAGAGAGAGDAPAPRKMKLRSLSGHDLSALSRAHE